MIRILSNVQREEEASEEDPQPTPAIDDGQKFPPGTMPAIDWQKRWAVPTSKKP
jgi:hypothetical protein